MKIQQKSAAMRLAVVGLALGLAVIGCSKDDTKDDESPSTSTSAATSAESSAPSSEEASEEPGSPTAEAAAGDLTVLLMKPESIPPAAPGPYVGEPPKVEQTPAPSVSQFYKSGDNNSIQSMITVMPDAEKAATVVKDTMSGPDLAAQIKGSVEPAPNVTEDALVLNGMSADGSAAMAVLMFSEENAVVQVTFLGQANDPVPADYLDSVGVVQLDAVQQGLPTLGE